MMDINLKLQLSAAKAQNKTIDLELRRMEAEEAMEHLQIVQVWPYFEIEVTMLMT